MLCLTLWCTLGRVQVPRERLLLETDCPDATPPAQDGGSLLPVSPTDCPAERLDKDKEEHPQATSRPVGDDSEPSEENCAAQCGEKRDERSVLSERLECACGGHGMNGGPRAREGDEQGGQETEQQKGPSPSRPLNHPGNITHVSTVSDIRTLLYRIPQPLEMKSIASFERGPFHMARDVRFFVLCLFPCQVCAFVANTMGLSKEEVGRIAYTNARRVFSHFA